MIGWGSIVYGAVLSAIAAGVSVVLVLRQRRPTVVAVAIGAALAGPIAWNSILHATHATRFFTDLPAAVFPVSWQDTGSGVFTLALASVALGTLRRHEPAGTVLSCAALVGIAAFLVDIYLY